MGYYYEMQFVTRLHKDTPEVIIKLIATLVYYDWKGGINDGCPDALREFYAGFIFSEDELKTNTPDHDFFKTERWMNVFGNSAFTDLTPGIFKEWKNGGFNGPHWQLQLNPDINYGHEEIQLFTDWISPYVYGRRKKQYLGWYKGEEQQERINLYVKRQ